MKNVFSLLLCCLTANLVFGQIEWVGKHGFTESGSDILPTTQRHYIMVHGDVNGITVFDSVGNMLFSKLLNSGASDEVNAVVSDFMELSDSSICFSYSLVGCDGIFSEIRIHNKYWEEIGVLDGGGFVGPAASFGNDEFVIGHADLAKIAKFNSTGMVWVKDFGNFNFINDLLVTPDNLILLATWGGLMILDNQSNVVDSLPDLVSNRLEWLPNGNFLAQSADEISTYNLDLQQLASVQLQPENINDLAIGSFDIAVLTSENKVKRFNLNLDNLNMDVQLPNENFNGLEFSGSGLMLTGNELGSSFIKEFGFDGSTINTAKDLSLTQVSHGGVTTIPHWTPINAEISDIKVIVKNEGATVVDYLKLNMPLPGYSTPSCLAEQSVSKDFENLDLQPGESRELIWGSQGIILEWGNPSNGFELCLYVSQPDHRLDANDADNSSCTDIILADNEPQLPAFHHYFNPATDELILEIQPELDLQRSAIYLFNAAGQLLRKMAVTEQRQVIDMSEWPQGAYFLQVVAGERVGRAKVVKY